MDYLFTVPLAEGITFMLGKLGFANVDFLGVEYQNCKVDMFLPKDVFDVINKKIFQTLFDSPQKWDNLHDLNRKNAKKLNDFSTKVKTLDAIKLTDKKLLEYIHQFSSIINKMALYEAQCGYLKPLIIL